MGIKRLSHAVYDTRYHLVWAPKYRKWVLKDEVREGVGELFKEILAARDCELIEMEIAGDHVHIFASIPPKYSVGEMVNFTKDNSMSFDMTSLSKYDLDFEFVPIDRNTVIAQVRDKESKVKRENYRFRFVMG